MKKPLIPDFNLLPWRKNNSFRLLSEDGLEIGTYTEFINEKTGDYGVRIDLPRIDMPLFAWEESLVFGGKEINCRYVAYRENDVWKRLRVKNYYPKRVSREAVEGYVKVTFHFELAIEQDLAISYKIRR